MLNGTPYLILSVVHITASAIGPHTTYRASYLSQPFKHRAKLQAGKLPSLGYD